MLDAHRAAAGEEEGGAPEGVARLVDEREALRRVGARLRALGRSAAEALTPERALALLRAGDFNDAERFAPPTDIHAAAEPGGPTPLSLAQAMAAAGAAIAIAVPLVVDRIEDRTGATAEESGLIEAMPESGLTAAEAEALEQAARAARRDARGRRRRRGVRVGRAAAAAPGPVCL